MKFSCASDTTIYTLGMLILNIGIDSNIGIAIDTMDDTFAVSIIGINGSKRTHMSCKKSGFVAAIIMSDLIMQ
jgi:hypothetical protein